MSQRRLWIALIIFSVAWALVEYMDTVAIRRLEHEIEATRDQMRVELDRAKKTYDEATLLRR